MKTQWSRVRRGLTALVVAGLGIASALCASATQTDLYYHNDLAGTPVAATDASGVVLWRQSYKPYGERLDPKAPAEQQPWFTGKTHVEAAGLSYFGARWYDPQLGRFMGVDPSGFDEANVHSFNRYAYANNNPYKFVDPDGRVAETIFDLINFGISVEMFRREPTLGNFLGAAVDGLAVAVPFIPGGVGAIRTIGKAAEAAADAEKSGTTLFRAVGPAELADIQANNLLRNLGSAEGKYFTTSADAASSYAKQAVKGFGDPPYTIIQTRVPNSILGGLTPATVDRGIPAWVIPNNRLPGLTPHVLDSMPIPRHP